MAAAAKTRPPQKSSFQVRDFDHGALVGTISDADREHLTAEFVAPALTGGNAVVPAFAPSTLYKFDDETPAASGGKGLPAGKEVVDTDLRASQWARITHEAGLSVADDVLRRLSRATTACNFVRVRDHVTLVYYQPGEFFKPHRDTALLVSGAPNRAREVHVMAVLTAPAGGGELRLVDAAGDEHLYQCSKGRVLAFDKSRLHEARPVTKGNKIVLLIDALAVVARDAPAAPPLTWLQQHFAPPGVLSANLELVADVARRNNLPFFLVTTGNDVTRVHDSRGVIYYKGDPEHAHHPGIDRQLDRCYGFAEGDYPVSFQCEEYPNQGWEITKFTGYGDQDLTAVDWTHRAGEHYRPDRTNDFTLQNQELPNGTLAEWVREHKDGILADAQLLAGQVPVPPTTDSRELLKFTRLATEDDAPPVNIIHEMGCNEGDYDVVVEFIQLAGIIIPPGTVLVT